MLDASYEGVKRLLVLGYDNTAGTNRVEEDSQKFTEDIFFQE